MLVVVPVQRPNSHLTVVVTILDERIAVAILYFLERVDRLRYHRAKFRENAIGSGKVRCFDRDK